MSLGLKEDSWSLVLRPADTRARMDTRTQAEIESRGVRGREHQASRLADSLDQDIRLLPAGTSSRENLDRRGSILRPAGNRGRGDTQIPAGTTSRESKESWIPGHRLEDSQEDRAILVNLEKWSLVLQPEGSPVRGDTRIQVDTKSREMGDRKNQASRVADSLDRDSRLFPVDTASRENLDTSD